MDVITYPRANTGPRYVCHEVRSQKYIVNKHKSKVLNNSNIWGYIQCTQYNGFTVRRWRHVVASGNNPSRQYSPLMKHHKSSERQKDI